MRRPAASFGLVALFAAACGLDVVGTAKVGAGPDASTSGARDGGATVDAGENTVDGGGLVSPDAAPAPVAPSHTTETFDPNAPSLSGITAIDTTGLAVTGPAVVPRFEDRNGLAVLWVKDWTVDVPARVVGTRKLVVLASGIVKVAAMLDAGGKGVTPGPGGAASGAGLGAGGNGVHAGADDSTGGGGGGFGGAGANGGNVGGAMGGAGGIAYGGSLADFVGGSGGGRGADSCAGDVGGGGGGALQITSAVSITVAGGINAGGGGGTGGCHFVSNAESAAGCGGGSGGLVFLEAPSIVVGGTLTANGGGGGGGSYYNQQLDGAPGADAVVGVAAGGTKASTSPGGAGATGTTAPVKPGGVVQNNAGGGGGGTGRIWLRTRGAKAVLQTSAGVSPAAAYDTSL